VRKLKEYYAVLQYYKYRKRKWSAAEESEPECVCRMWNISRYMVSKFHSYQCKDSHHFHTDQQPPEL
jgi:hypothetical protein